MWRADRLYSVNRSLACVLLGLLACTMAGRAQRIVTSQYDNARTGVNPRETTLTRNSLESSSP
jgi:hypothetical protein